MLAALQLPGLGPPRYPTNHELRASPSSPLALLSSSLPSPCLSLNSAALLGLQETKPYQDLCVSVHTGKHVCRMPCVHMCLCSVCAHLHACGLVCMHAWCLCVQMCMCSGLPMQMSQYACVHACMHEGCLVCRRACLFCAHESRACVPVCIRAGMCMHAPV